MKQAAFLVLIALLVFVSACQQPQQPTASTNNNASAGKADWDGYVAKFLGDYFAANPTFAVIQGKHEYDGKFPDWSDAGLQKEISRLKSERTKAADFKDSDLEDHQKLERDYLIAQIDKDIFWRETADQPHTNPYYYADAIDPDVYVSRPYAPLDARLKAYTTYAKNVPAALQQIKANLKAPLAMNLIKIGRQTIGGLADFYEKDVPKVFASVTDEQLQNDFKTANDGAIKAVRDFDAWLGEQEKTANNNFALGPDKFRAMLKQT